MKISATVIARNHEYGTVSLRNRSILCLNSLIDTFDEVSYVDWASPQHSLLYDIKDELNLKGNLKHFVVDQDIAGVLSNFNPNIQKPCEVLARNIGLRRSTGDWWVSTNIDVICPERQSLIDLFTSLDQNTMYTISRRSCDFEKEKQYHETLNTGNNIYKDWKLIRNHLNETVGERKMEEKVLVGDDYSLINCPGDFQCAPRHIWEDIRGFEEELVYALYTDTNVQKKAVMHGYGLKALFSPPLFHIDHGPGGGGFCSGYNPIANDPKRAIVFQQKTLNPETWGFSEPPQGFSDLVFQHELL
jgi:hypothetical protein